MLWLVAVLSFLIFFPVARVLKKQMVSSSKWVNLWEALVSYVHDEIVEPNFDHHYTNKAMPYFCTLFFFILFSNLIGLISGRIGGIIGIGQDVMTGIRAHAAMNAANQRTHHLASQLLTHPFHNRIGFVGSYASGHSSLLRRFYSS